MYQVIEVKDMNIGEAIALCKQEYMEEMQKVKIMPPIDQTMEDLLVEVIHKAKSATYGKALICEEKLVGFLAFLGPWEGFHGVEKGLNSCCNVDWQDCTIMIVETKPENGYASVSTCNMDFLGFGEDYLPEGFLNKMLALSAVYVPLDGMNEMGLCVADLMIDTDENICQDTGKTSLTTTTAIRLLLDKAATVDEAVKKAV